MGRQLGDIMRPLIKIDEDTGCWMWQGQIHKSGYPRKKFAGRAVAAHRWVYSWFNGRLPADAMLHHTCGVKVCVNPSHLEAVSPAELYRRGEGAKLTASQVAAIRERLAVAERGDQALLARLYGVTQAAISHINTGHTWSHVQTPD